MSKRQKRIKAIEIVAHLPQIKNYKANIILKDGKVYHGIITDCLNGHIFFCDLRQQKFNLQLDIVDEIIIDHEASYAKASSD